jgi:ribonuclease HI
VEDYNSVYILQFDGQFLQHGGDNIQPSHSGLMGYGWLIFQDHKLVARGWGAFAQGKNAASNIAEYLALIEGLEALTDMGICTPNVEIHGDARCVIDQMSGLALVHSEPTRPLYQRARRLALQLGEIQWVWIPRRSNKNADRLSRQAIRQMHHIPGAFQRALMIISKCRKYEAVFDLRVYQACQSSQSVFTQR